jgi:hypothetical protein
MINQLLHRQPVAVDRNEHRSLRVRVPVTDWSVASRLNALFVAAVEFGDVARDFPIVFVRAGTDDDGQPAIAPIAVFGLVQEENLYVERGEWRARYIPAALNAYPFCIARVDAGQFAVCLDAGWSGLSGTEGMALFDGDGQPTQYLSDVQRNLERLEAEVQRTRLMCRRLRELNLLRDMRFDVTLRDGAKLAVDGFLTVDEKALTDLPDAAVLELHRNGLLGLVHAHYVSLGNMRKLVDWHIARAPLGA